jgi:hypothetical protein
MKKIVLIMFTALYLCFAIGISISKHFCGGKLSFVSFYNQVDEKDCCGDNHEDGCCKDENNFIKIKDDQQHKIVSTTPTFLLVDKIVFNSYYSFVFLIEQLPIKKQIYPPPILAAQQPIYLQYQVFRI